MRYKETEKILFKFHSGISDPNDYYVVKSEIGWTLTTESTEKVRLLVGDEVISKLEWD